MKDGERARATEIVRAVVAEWRPFAWAEVDPDDPELHGEARAVVRQIGRIASPHDAAAVLARVFAASFSAPDRFTAETCAASGALLYARLREARLVP